MSRRTSLRGRDGRRWREWRELPRSTSGSAQTHRSVSECPLYPQSGHWLKVGMSAMGQERTFKGIPRAQVTARELYARFCDQLAPTNPAIFPAVFSRERASDQLLRRIRQQSCVAWARCARFKLADVPLSPARPRSARPRR